MRITLEFSSNNLFSLPLSYHHILQGFIYNQLKNDAEYSAFLHNNGFKYNDTNRNFKLFSFSTLQGKYQIVNDKIYFHDKFKLEITSVDSTFCHLLVNAFIANPNLELAYQSVKLENISIENKKIEVPSVKIRMLSPLTLHRTYEDEFGTKKTLFLSPDLPEFNTALNDNFKRKYQAYYNILTDDIISIESLDFSPKNKYITRFKNKIIIVGWKGTYRLTGKTESLDFLYHCGLGAKNSQGFGMFRVID